MREKIKNSAGVIILLVLECVIIGFCCYNKIQPILWITTFPFIIGFGFIVYVYGRQVYSAFGLKKEKLSIKSTIIISGRTYMKIFLKCYDCNNFSELYIIKENVKSEINTFDHKEIEEARICFQAKKDYYEDSIMAVSSFSLPFLFVILPLLFSLFFPGDNSFSVAMKLFGFIELVIFTFWYVLRIDRYRHKLKFYKFVIECFDEIIKEKECDVRCTKIIGNCSDTCEVVND